MSQSTDQKSASDQRTLELARDIISQEISALEAVRERLDGSFCRAAEIIFQVTESGGCAVVTGMGKAGLVGSKIAATLASTGTRAHSMHPGEAVHGDLGRINERDVVVALSFSGETEEVVRLAGPIREIGAKLIGITARHDSRLARRCDETILLGTLVEACPLGLAPSASTTAMMAVGDAIAFVLSSRREFGREHFARFHPGGSLGRMTGPVDECMRTGDQLRITQTGSTVREALVKTHRELRRTGAMLVVDDSGILRGIFTDSDLAKLLQRHQDQVLDTPIELHMNQSPTVVLAGTRLFEAISMLSSGKFSQLPVVDRRGVPVGILDITDVVGLVPSESERVLKRAA